MSSSPAAEEGSGNPTLSGNGNVNFFYDASILRFSELATSHDVAQKFIGISEFDSDAAVSVLGYSENDSHDPCAFIGKFFVQPMYYENELTVLGEIMVEVLERFVRNRGRAPARVIIYRNGCSQDEYQRVLGYEIPIVLHYVKNYAPGAPITVLVPSLLHYLRFFKKQVNPTARAPEQNIPRGTVIDNCCSCKGTARPLVILLFLQMNKVILLISTKDGQMLFVMTSKLVIVMSVPAPVYRLTKLSPEQQKASLAMSAENEKDDSKSEYYLKNLQYNYSFFKH